MSVSIYKNDKLVRRLVKIGEPSRPNQVFHDFRFQGAISWGDAHLGHLNVRQFRVFDKMRKRTSLRFSRSDDDDPLRHFNSPRILVFRRKHLGRIRIGAALLGYFLHVLR